MVAPKSGQLLMLLDQAAAAQLPPTDASGVGHLEITR
jgi:hypothetical protein